MIQSDAEFAGVMTVEAFESKFKWAVGEKNMPAAKRFTGETLRTGSKDYPRIFVATYQGQPAGICALKFHGDGDIGGNVNPSNYLPCCATCGLCCMGCVLGGESVHKKHCYIDHICVDSAYRGKGIGKSLMVAADNEARRRGCTSMILYVARENRAKNLYERQGYRVIETEDGCCITYCAVGMRYFYKMEKPLY